MSQKNLFSRILNTSTILSLSAVLLGVAFVTPGSAMDQEERQSISPVINLESYADLGKGLSPSIPAIQPGDLLIINTGHGLIRSCTNISKSNTEADLFNKHEAFITSIKPLNENELLEQKSMKPFDNSKYQAFPDYAKLTYKAGLGKGKEAMEFYKVGEAGLPDLLDNLSAAGVSIIPITSRGDDGRNELPAVLSRTEKELVDVNYNWKDWKKPGSFQDLKQEVYFQDNSPDVPGPEVHGRYRLRNGVIYNVSSSPAPHKSAAIVGLINVLKEEGHLPSALYVTDREKTVIEIFEDLKGRDFGIPLYPLSYTQPKAFRTPEDLKEFYIFRLGAEKFQSYESNFNEIFNSSK